MERWRLIETVCRLNSLFAAYDFRAQFNLWFNNAGTTVHVK